MRKGPAGPFLLLATLLLQAKVPKTTRPITRMGL